MAYVRRFDVEGEAMVEYNNLTIINLLLKAAGPLRERDLTLLLLLLQAGLQITRVFYKKKPAQWVFLGFLVFFGFFLVFLGGFFIANPGSRWPVARSPSPSATH